MSQMTSEEFSSGLPNNATVERSLPTGGPIEPSSRFGERDSESPADFLESPRRSARGTNARSKRSDARLAWIAC